MTQGTDNNTGRGPVAIDTTAMLAKFSKEDMAKAIKAVEYKYFGDYEMDENQRSAVEKLAQFAAISFGVKADALCYGGESMNKLYHSLS
jgi:hypothetical protein